MPRMSRRDQIIRGWVEHKDSIMSQRLGEIVSELYVCADPKKAEKLWVRAGAALENTSANKVRVEKLLAEKNLKGLAELVGELF